MPRAPAAWDPADPSGRAAPCRRAILPTRHRARGPQGTAAPDETRPLFIPELNHPRRIEGVVRGLRQRKYATEVIEKIIGGNFHRVFKEIWTL